MVTLEIHYFKEQRNSLFFLQVSLQILIHRVSHTFSIIHVNYYIFLQTIMHLNKEEWNHNSTHMDVCTEEKWWTFWESSGNKSFCFAIFFSSHDVGLLSTTEKKGGGPLPNCFLTFEEKLSHKTLYIVSTFITLSLTAKRVWLPKKNLTSMTVCSQKIDMFHLFQVINALLFGAFDWWCVW